MELKEIELIRIDGTRESMENYLGKVLLIVNTASKCGFTPQYHELERLYETYRGRGFEILAFPCNQFKDQEPEGEREIQKFCQVNYGVTFPLFEKIEVKGEAAHPLFQWLTREKGFQGFRREHPLSAKLHEILVQEDPDYLNGNDVMWNFTKFLLDSKGKVRMRFEPTEDMETVEYQVKKLLEE